jgi:activating signal cointegrator complex subunit 3
MLPVDVIRNLEEKHASTQDILDIGEGKGVGQLCHNIRAGSIALDLTRKLPRLDISASIQPITRGILRVTLQVRCAFRWHDQWHSSVEPWWIWVEDSTSERVYHSEPWLLHKKQKDETHVVAFTIPIFEPLPPQYYVRAVSDRWVGCETVIPVSFKHLILPDKHPPHTDLLDLAPLPKSALNNPTFEALYKFNFFNPIQVHSCTSHVPLI